MKWKNSNPPSLLKVYFQVKEEERKTDLLKAIQRSKSHKCYGCPWGRFLDEKKVVCMFGKCVKGKL